ncbi:hypothetical protein N657DRAFT_639617 [Parathielavia appendiculata]|uniref:Secreted protein n=1 Tax=Parathielavia appendiculata TaxID=2587402 RepID=A0AAN6U9U4_9PEZI|nr:hypothetical protein N657DRAFT_639617 [Parathielavia appendiculata]
MAAVGCVCQFFVLTAQLIPLWFKAVSCPAGGHWLVLTSCHTGRIDQSACASGRVGVLALPHQVARWNTAPAFTDAGLPGFLKNLPMGIQTRADFMELCRRQSVLRKSETGPTLRDGSQRRTATAHLATPHHETGPLNHQLPVDVSASPAQILPRTMAMTVSSSGLPSPLGPRQVLVRPFSLRYVASFFRPAMGAVAAFGSRSFQQMLSCSQLSPGSERRTYIKSSTRTAMLHTQGLWTTPWA